MEKGWCVVPLLEAVGGDGPSVNRKWNEIDEDVTLEQTGLVAGGIMTIYYLLLEYDYILYVNSY